MQSALDLWLRAPATARLDIVHHPAAMNAPKLEDASRCHQEAAWSLPAASALFEQACHHTACLSRVIFEEGTLALVISTLPSAPPGSCSWPRCCRFRWAGSSMEATGALLAWEAPYQGQPRSGRHARHSMPPAATRTLWRFTSTGSAALTLVTLPYPRQACIRHSCMLQQAGSVPCLQAEECTRVLCTPVLETGACIHNEGLLCASLPHLQLQLQLVGERDAGITQRRGSCRDVCWCSLGC